MFRKLLCKTAAYRKTQDVDMLLENMYADSNEQPDYTFTIRRLSDPVENAESDTRANRKSDRHPVINTTLSKLVSLRQEVQGRERYNKGGTEENETINNMLAEDRGKG